LKKDDRMVRGVILSYLIQDLKYDVMNETSAKSIWEILTSKYLTKIVENCLHLKRRLYHFQLKGGISNSDHIDNYTTLLTDLINLDVVIEDEDKVLILLSSLPNERYEIFVLTLINVKTSLSYSEVTTTLVNLELRKKDNEYSTSDTSAVILAARGSNPNQRRGNQ